MVAIKLALTAALFSLVSVAHSQLDERPCGGRIAPCPDDQRCVPNDPSCATKGRCFGTCRFKNQYPDCGGHRPNAPVCKRGTSCVDDPRIPDSCGLACDIPGICLPDKAHDCGGFIGKQCPKGLYCYDVPNDGCDPMNGGADCPGICV